MKRLRLSRALTISDGSSVADACRRMATRRVDAALLVDSSALLCGIITDKVQFAASISGSSVGCTGSCARLNGGNSSNHSGSSRYSEACVDICN